jgi:hypothetical protein
VNKFTPMVFLDNPGWPFSPQLKWINSQISDCGKDSTDILFITRQNAIKDVTNETGVIFYSEGLR